MLVGVDEFEQVNIALSRFGNFGLKRFTLLKQYNKKFSALFTEMGIGVNFLSSLLKAVFGRICSHR